MFQLLESQLELILSQRSVEEFVSLQDKIMTIQSGLPEPTYLIYCQLPIFCSRHEKRSLAFVAQSHHEKFCERRESRVETPRGLRSVRMSSCCVSQDIWQEGEVGGKKPDCEQIGTLPKGISCYYKTAT